MSKKKPNQPRHKAANIRYSSFSDESSSSKQLVAVTAEMILQYARFAESDHPAERMKGREKIRMIAEFCIAGQFALDDQTRKSRTPRGTIETDNGRTSAAAIIRELAPMKDHLGDYLKPKELRPLFFAKLDELGLSPVEDKLGVTFGDDRRTWDSFRAAISREREKIKSET